MKGIKKDAITVREVGGRLLDKSQKVQRMFDRYWEVEQ